MNIALLVIDMQKAYYTKYSKESMDLASWYIQCIIETFRKNNKKIIWAQNAIKDDLNIRGTEGFEIIDILEPRSDEKVIIKEYDNAFNKTELYEYLVQEGIDTIIITGYCAEYCVLSTYRGAKDKDIMPIILKNAIASGNKENIKFVEEISEIITLKALEKVAAKTF
jgi:nicotinamidase-related amidase